MNYKIISMILGTFLLLSASCSNNSGARNLTVLDENIPVAYIHAYEHLYDDINAITDAAEVVFIGRVVDYKERLIIEPPTTGMLSVAESDWEVVDVYEGIVLEADEVLIGEMPESESRITLGVLALQETLDGSKKSRLFDREIELFEDGIRSIGSDDSPQYLVYAGPSDLGTQGYALGLYWIKTLGGVVRIYDDNSLGYGKGKPFIDVVQVDEEGEYDWVFPYDLQDARDAAELAKSGIEDTVGPPEEQTTGLDEVPAEEESNEQAESDSGEADSDAETIPDTGSKVGDTGTDKEGSAELGDGNSGDPLEESLPDANTPNTESESGTDNEPSDASDQPNPNNSDQPDLGGTELLGTESDDSPEEESNEQAESDSGEANSDAESTPGADSDENAPSAEDGSTENASDPEDTPQQIDSSNDAPPKTSDKATKQDDPAEEGALGTGDGGVQTPGGLDVGSPGG